jgi:hypothetical protein
MKSTFTLAFIFFANLAFCQIASKPITVEIVDTIVTKIRSQEFQKLYQNNLKEHIESEIFQQSINSFITHSNEKRLKVVKGRSKKDAQLRLEFVVFDTMILFDLRGWVDVIEVKLRLVNKFSNDYGRGGFRQLASLIWFENKKYTKEQLSYKYSICKMTNSMSLGVNYYSVSSKYVPHNNIKAKASCSINSYFKVKGLESPKDSLLSKYITDIANNSIIHSLSEHTEKRGEMKRGGFEGLPFKEFNYFDNYVRKDKQESD